MLLYTLLLLLLFTSSINTQNLIRPVSYDPVPNSVDATAFLSSTGGVPLTLTSDGSKELIIYIFN